MAKKEETQYTREVLIRDARYAHIQQDFLGAILSKPMYTLSEADEAINKFFNRKESD